MEYLRGFEVQLIQMSMQDHKVCRQVILPDGVTLQPADSQIVFQAEVSGLDRREDYSVLVWSLPKQQDGDKNNFIQQTYKAARSNSMPTDCPQQRKVARRWHPKTPEVTTVGRQVFIKAKTTRVARFNCIKQYALYLGTPSDNPAYPEILEHIDINLTHDEVNRKYFHYTISDLSPGNYTIQYAISLHDPVRSYPVQVTVKDWVPNNVTLQTNGRNATVRFDAPPKTYNLSTCHVRIFLHDDLKETISKEFDPNQSVVTVNFRHLSRGTYRVQVSAPFKDALPIDEKEFSITDWVPDQDDIQLTSMEETANSTRVTVAFPRPPPSHDYSSVYVYYGPEADLDNLQSAEISKPQGDDRNNITVQLDVIKGSDLFFQVSAPYDDAELSDLKHFQIPEVAVSQQTWFLGVTAGIGGGLVLVLLLIAAYIKRLAKKKSTSFMDIVRGLVTRRTGPTQVPEITEPPKILVISAKTPPSHGGPNGAVHQFAKFLQTGLYCDVTTELTSQREVDLVGAAQWYIDKIEAADFNVVVCPPSSTGTEPVEPDAMFTHCVRILGDKLSSDPANQHHKCLTVRFEYSGKQTIPQVLRTAGHYKINARDPDFEDAMLNLFCHIHKFERYQLHPESWTIRLGEQDNVAKACRRDLQSVLSQNAAVLGSPESGTAGGGLEQGGGLRADPTVPNTPDQLPHGSSLESLMEREYELEGETQGVSLGLVCPDEISQVNSYLDGGCDHLPTSPTASMYSAGAGSADVSVLGEQGAEGVTRIAVEGEGGSLADVLANGAQAGAHHVVSMKPAHIGRDYVEGAMRSSEADDHRVITGQHCNNSKDGQTKYKTPDQVAQEENLEFDIKDQREGLAYIGLKYPDGHLPASSTHDTGYHSATNNSEPVVRPKFPPHQFRHYPYAERTPYSQRRPLPGAVVQSGQRQTRSSHADVADGRLHLEVGEHHTAGLYSSLQAAETTQASPPNATSLNPPPCMSANFRPASPGPPAGSRPASVRTPTGSRPSLLRIPTGSRPASIRPPAGSRPAFPGPSATPPLGFHQVTPPLQAGRPPQLPPTSDNVEDQLSQFNFRYIDK